MQHFLEVRAGPRTGCCVLRCRVPCARNADIIAVSSPGVAHVPRLFVFFILFLAMNSASCAELFGSHMAEHSLQGSAARAPGSGVFVGKPALWFLRH